MNKKLIALAVGAALAAPMSANAGATWYGHLFAEVSSEDSDFAQYIGQPNSALEFDGHVIENRSSDGTDITGGRMLEDGTTVQDNKRGRLGVKGSEDLGGGLKAIYRFEFQVSTVQADVDDGDRNSFVGLKGGFGTIKIGSLKTPYKYMGGVKYDPFVTTNIEARRYGGMTRGAFGQNSFFDRAVGYENKFGAGKLWLVYVPDEDTGQDGDYSAGFMFKGGKTWEAFVATAVDNDTDNNPSNGTLSYTALKVGGAWKTGPHKLKFQYETTTDEQGAAGDDEGTLIFLGYEMKMGKNVFVAQVADGSVDFAGPGADQESTYYAIGVVHKFSKKTRAFLGYSNTSIDNAGGASGVNGDRSAFTVGLRVDF